MAIEDRIRELVVPVLRAHDAELYDLQFEGGILRVLLDREGGIDIDTIGSVSREVSRLLDDTDPIPGSFTLEVSSPGLERRLRTPEHFIRAVGETVTVKTVAGLDGPRRFKAVISAADPERVTFDPLDGDQRILGHDELERVRTVFDWSASPKPGSSKKAEKKAAKP